MTPGVILGASGASMRFRTWHPLTAAMVSTCTSSEVGDESEKWVDSTSRLPVYYLPRTEFRAAKGDNLIATRD
jgi:hypothetical protein